MARPIGMGLIALCLGLVAACGRGAASVAEIPLDAGLALDPDALDGGGPLDQDPSQTDPSDLGQAAEPVPGGPLATPVVLSTMPAQRPPGATQLTEAGCCAAPAWTADGERVVFLDRRDDVTAMYGVHIDRPGDVQVVLDEVAAYTAGFEYRIDPNDQSIRLTRLSDGDVWELPTGGRSVVVSPDGEAAAWSDFNRDAEPENRRTKLRVMLRGEEPATIAELGRGSLSGWLGVDQLLASRRPDSNSEMDELVVVDLDGGTQRLLVATERLRGVSVAPGGRRLAAHATGNGPLIGLFLVDVATGDVTNIPDALFGAYRWRDADRLLIIPMVPGERHRLVEYHVDTGEQRELVTADEAPFKVANGDWSVAPGGQRIVWVEASDKSVWMRELPE